MNQQEKESYLNFFYLIDTHRLVSELKPKLTSDLSADDLFTLIFSKIEYECRPYLEFLSSPHSFNHTDIDKTLSARAALLRLVLKHHCILHGFLTSLKKSDSGDMPGITIRGANNTKLRTGYFNTNGFTDSPSLLPNGEEPSIDIPKNYNGYQKRFNKYPNHYSYQILNGLSLRLDHGFIHVPSYFGNWACFIYSNPLVKTVDDNIYANSNRLQYNYDNLSAECISWCNDNKLSFEDKLLFEYAMESVYGFSFFGYATNLLRKIHNTNSEKAKITYKDFEGQFMLNIIQQVAQLPIVYNRSVFLEHCLYSAINSKYLTSQEYRKGNTSLFMHTSRKPAPKELLFISGLEHIEKYLQKLKYLVIPLLENLWDTIIYRLNESFPNSNDFFIDINTYRTYIHKNYPVIARDYSCFFDNDKVLSEFYEDSLYHDTYKTSNLLYEKNAYTDIKFSKGESNPLKQLLIDYFKPERPFSPSPILYDLLMPNSNLTHSFDKISTHTEELNFHKNHSENILSFAESIAPFNQ